MPAATRDVGLASDGMIALRHKGLGHGADPDTLVQRDETGFLPTDVDGPEPVLASDHDDDEHPAR
jgi:hypothetical protein